MTFFVYLIILVHLATLIYHNIFPHLFPTRFFVWHSFVLIFSNDCHLKSSAFNTGFSDFTICHVSRLSDSRQNPDVSTVLFLTFNDNPACHQSKNSNLWTSKCIVVLYRNSRRFPGRQKLDVHLLYKILLLTLEPFLSQTIVVTPDQF